YVFRSNQSYGKRIPFSNIQGNKIKEIFILTQNILRSHFLLNLYQKLLNINNKKQSLATVSNYWQELATGNNNYQELVTFTNSTLKKIL
ncbi:hypothetical protein ACTQ08_09760, partial [Lactobacillus amylovorus]